MRIKVGAMLIALALLALVYGSAALTTVAIDRTYNVSSLRLNTDVHNRNGVVRIITLLTKNDAVSFDLSQALTYKPIGSNPRNANTDNDSESHNTYEPLPITDKDKDKDKVVPVDLKPVLPEKPVPPNKPTGVPLPVASAGVKVEALNAFETLMTKDADGVVSFDLNQAFNNNLIGFNPKAQFTIGSADTGVFRITNNSNTSIKVSLEAGEHGGLALKDSNEGAPSIIAAGAAQTFYFEIDTTGISPGNAINGILLIREL